jgi:hypothetical protein
MRFDNYASSTASDLAARAYIIDKTDRISHALDLMEKTQSQSTARHERRGDLRRFNEKRDCTHTGG